MAPDLTHLPPSHGTLKFLPFRPFHLYFVWVMTHKNKSAYSHPFMALPGRFPCYNEWTNEYISAECLYNSVQIFMTESRCSIEGGVVRRPLDLWWECTRFWITVSDISYLVDIIPWLIPIFSSIKWNCHEARTLCSYMYINRCCSDVLPTMLLFKTLWSTCLVFGHTILLWRYGLRNGFQ